MPLRVAAVQLAFQYFSTPQEFADYVREPIEQARAAGADLVLLPHQLSFGLFGMFDFDAAPGDAFDTLAQRQQTATQLWLAERAVYVYEFYLHTFQSLAARTDVWLAPGTVLEPEGDTLYVSAFLLNASGEIVGRQHQLHLTPTEKRWGASEGDTLQVFKTEVGDHGLIVGSDIHSANIAQGLVARGANVLLHPAIEDDTALRQAVETYQVFGIQAALLDAQAQGQTGIYAPSLYAPAHHGILAQAEAGANVIVLADLDFAALPVGSTGA